MNRLAVALPQGGEYIALTQLLRQLGHLLEKISYKSHVGDLENWRIRIFIDTRNNLAILHASQMLDRSTDTCA